MKYQVKGVQGNTERYVWENGEVKKKYAIMSTEEGEWLQNKKVLDASERPVFYDYAQIFLSEREAHNIA